MNYNLVNTLLNFTDEELDSDWKVSINLFNDRNKLIDELSKSEKYFNMKLDNINENDLSILIKEIKDIIIYNNGIGSTIYNNYKMDYEYRDEINRKINLRDLDSTKFTDIQNRLFKILIDLKRIKLS